MIEAEAVTLFAPSDNCVIVTVLVVDAGIWLVSFGAVELVWSLPLLAPVAGVVDGVTTLGGVEVVFSGVDEPDLLDQPNKLPLKA